MIKIIGKIILGGIVVMLPMFIAGFILYWAVFH
jgi:hypothetical protein